MKAYYIAIPFSTERIARIGLDDITRNLGYTGAVVSTDDLPAKGYDAAKAEAAKTAAEHA